MFFGSGPYAATPFAGTFGLEPSSISGTLAAQESGSDIASIIGGNGVGGFLSVQEAGDDLFTGAGYQPAFGHMDALETGSDTFTGSARLGVRGIMAAFELGGDAFTASGFSVINGHMLAIEDADIFAGLIKVPAYRMTGGFVRGVVGAAATVSRYAESRR